MGVNMRYETAYAYASSPAAESLGMGKTGCYYVTLLNRPASPGFATHNEAREWAKANGGFAEEKIPGNSRFYRYY